MKIEQFLQSLNELRSLVDKSAALYNRIEAVSNQITASLQNGGKLLICGNGGSAADAQHMAAEFVNRFLQERKPLAAIALSTDTSNLTSIANDYSFDEVFSKQVEALGKKGDVLIGISTSGNSKNILKAHKVARKIGISTVGILGKDGGEIRNFSDVPLIVESQSTPRIQEMHMFIIHTICQMVEENIFGQA